MKFARSKKSKKGRIEIIPMIDVMFFLLITFILASLSMQNLSGLVVNLNQGKADKITLEKEITLTVSKNNEIFFGKEKIASEALKTRLEEILRGKKTVIIASDKNAFQGIVMQVMLTARAAGADHFLMVARN